MNTGYSCLLACVSGFLLGVKDIFAIIPLSGLYRTLSSSDIKFRRRRKTRSSQLHGKYWVR